MSLIVLKTQFDSEHQPLPLRQINSFDLLHRLSQWNSFGSLAGPLDEAQEFASIIASSYQSNFGASGRTERTPVFPVGTGTIAEIHSIFLCKLFSSSDTMTRKKRRNSFILNAQNKGVMAFELPASCNRMPVASDPRFAATGRSCLCPIPRTGKLK
jgi:hypothetical protein